VHFSQLSKLRDLDLDRRSVTLVRICGRGLPTHQIRWKSEKLFVDVRTDGHRDGRPDTPEFQFTRSSVGDDLIKLVYGDHIISV